jgi:hypothetical protein
MYQCGSVSPSEFLFFEQMKPVCFMSSPAYFICDEVVEDPEIFSSLRDSYSQYKNFSVSVFQEAFLCLNI